MLSTESSECITKSTGRRLETRNTILIARKAPPGIIGSRLETTKTTTDI